MLRCVLLEHPVRVLGILLAVATALGWAGQYVFIRLATREGSVLDAMLVALVCNALLIVPAVAIWYYPAYGVTAVSAVAFAAGGIAGSFLSRILQFVSTKTIGASRTAPTVSSSALIAALLAVAFLGETLTAIHLLGIVLIVLAIAIVAMETSRRPPGTRPDEAPWRSMVLPLLAAVFLGIEPILLKIGFAEGTPTLVGLAIMVSAALVSYVAYQRLTAGMPSPDLVSAPELKWYVGAGVAGTVSLIAYFAALSLAPVVLVVPIIQTAPLLVVGISLLFLPRTLEHITWRLAAAAGIVVLGTIMVSLSA